MSEESTDRRVVERAHELTPEERAVGSDNPSLQAAAILADSDERTNEASGKAQIGVTGLAVMGRNLARNLASHGFRVALHNRTQARTDSLLADHGGDGDFVGSTSLQEFVDSLETPRKIIIMVKAGAPTDDTIDQLSELLEDGDIIIDAGNANFTDTRRRESALRKKGLRFVGAGVSGGEEGALKGPSIMPGGDPSAYKELAPMLEAIAAHVDGEPCCVHVGPDGAGHFVKMVHNGIEYADMQLIAEAYDILRHGLNASPAELSSIFANWNSGDLDSFLIEITAQVLAKTDPGSGAALVDVIRDAAEQKGTGRWTVQIALDLGVPVSGIAEAVFARAVSGHVSQREAVAAALSTERPAIVVSDRDAFIENVRQALYAAKIVAYAQGMHMIAAASAEYEWNINLADMAKIWRGGCIIRARLLSRITEAYQANPDLPSLLVAPGFSTALLDSTPSWRSVVSQAVLAGVPVPALSATLAYYDSLRAERLPAALIQGLRDLFGAHTYQRIDKAGTFHIEWTGDGSETASN
jgi:6-phosphogluconate dehydrogenase